LVGLAALVQMVNKVTAPDEMTTQAAMSEGNGINRLVGQERQRDDQPFAALTACDRAPDQTLSEKIQYPVVRRARGEHPRIGADERAGKVLF
jgi:hypothetical protein